MEVSVETMNKSEILKIDNMNVGNEAMDVLEENAIPVTTEEGADDVKPDLLNSDEEINNFLDFMLDKLNQAVNGKNNPKSDFFSGKETNTLDKANRATTVSEDYVELKDKEESLISCMEMKGNTTEILETSTTSMQPERSSTRNNTYQCHICLKDCETYTLLTRHIDTHSIMKGSENTKAIVEGKIQCIFCLKYLKKQYNVNMHVRKACPVLMSRNWMLHTDISLTNNGKSYTRKCDDPMTVSNETKMPFKCMFCHGYFAEPHHVKSHVRSCSVIMGKNWMQNVDVESILANSSIYLPTIEVVMPAIQSSIKTKRYRCSLCPQWYTKKASLTLHRLIKHKGRQFYSCHICGKGLSSKSSTYYHLKNCHPEKDEWLDCKICGIRIQGYSSYKEHVDYNHVSDKVTKMISCTDCNITFHSNEDLTLHRKSWIHLCKIQAFLKPQFLSKKSGNEIGNNGQNVTVTSVPTISCDTCGKVFMKRALYVDHKMVHEYNNKIKSQITQIHTPLGHAMQADETFESPTATTLRLSYQPDISSSEEQEELQKASKIVVNQCNDIGFVNSDKETKEINKHTQVEANEHNSVSNCSERGNTDHHEVVPTSLANVTNYIQQAIISKDISIKLAKPYTNGYKLFNQIQVNEIVNHCRLCYADLNGLQITLEHLSKHNYKVMCIFCHRELSKNESVLAHITRDHGLTPIKHTVSCDLCAKNIMNSTEKPEDIILQINQIKPSHNISQISCEAYTEKLEILTKQKSPNSSICNFCDFKLDNWKLLNNHIGFHFSATVNLRSICNHCGIDFNSDEIINKYELLYYTKPQNTEYEDQNISIRCPICEEMCKNAYELFIHCLFHVTPPFYSCTICRCHFSKLSSLKEHLKSHQKYNCRFCCAFFDKSGKRQRHETSNHLKEMLFKCDICSRPLPTKLAVLLHKSHQHIKKLNCVTCKQRFRTSEHLETHISDTHGEGINRLCHICGKKIRRRAYSRHMKLHEKKDKMCHLCPDSRHYYNNQGLQKHIEGHQRPKHSQCEYCGKSLCASAMAIHINQHIGNKTEKCNLCEKAYYTKQSLTLHRRSAHTNERPFKCSYCEAAFTGESNLKDHIRIHTGEKPYVCPICQKAFTKSCNMKKHVKLMH